MFFGNQADKLKGEIMAKVKEVWVRFSDTETYYEKERVAFNSCQCIRRLCCKGVHREYQKLQRIT